MDSFEFTFESVQTVPETAYLHFVPIKPFLSSVHQFSRCSFNTLILFSSVHLTVLSNVSAPQWYPTNIGFNGVVYWLHVPLEYHRPLAPWLRLSRSYLWYCLCCRYWQALQSIPKAGGNNGKRLVITISHCFGTVNIKLSGLQEMFISLHWEVIFVILLQINKQHK